LKRTRKWLGLLPRQTQVHPDRGQLFFRCWIFEPAFVVCETKVQQLRRFRLMLLLLLLSSMCLVWQIMPQRCPTLNPIWWCNWREIGIWSLPILGALFYQHGTRRLLLQNQRTSIRLSLFGRMAGQGFSGIGHCCGLLAIAAFGLFWLSVLDWWLMEQPVLEYYGLAASAHLGMLGLIGVALEDTAASS
jgi:hypothetical protein